VQPKALPSTYEPIIAKPVASAGSGTPAMTPEAIAARCDPQSSSFKSGPEPLEWKLSAPRSIEPSPSARLGEPEVIGVRVVD
jgi:hypothetical protein